MPNRPRRLIRRLLEPDPGTSRWIPTGPARGIRFAAEPAATASADLWVGLFESELAPVIRRLATPGTRCVDVGANSGYYTLVLAARCRASVIAYEPDPAARQRLHRNLTLNPALAPYVDLRTRSVGEQQGPTTVTLDEDLPDSPAIGLLKVDVDGPEARVLAGAQRLLATTRPHVIVETHSADLERVCAQQLIAAGYRPRVLAARRRLPQNRGAEHNRGLLAEGAPRHRGGAAGRRPPVRRSAGAPDRER